MLKEQLVPWINPTFKKCGITLRQDGATSHIANLVQECCTENMAGLWTKELWPYSSPDLNPMDFAVWCILESNACSSYHPSATSLKAKFKHCWDKISPENIRVSCNQVYVKTDILIIQRCRRTASSQRENLYRFLCQNRQSDIYRAFARIRRPKKAE